MTRLQDKAVRDRAQQDFDHNLVLTAGAGTGKTSLLTGRTLAALLFEGLDAEQVLITTFTEKAAAEMFERIEQALLSIAEGRPNEDARRCLIARGADPDDTALEQKAARLVEGDELPSISTFHAWCLGLIREHAKPLAFSPLARIRDDEERFEEFEEQWQAFLQFELGTARLPEGTILDLPEWRGILALPGLEDLKALVWSYLDLSPERGIRWDEGIEALHAEARRVLALHGELFARHRETQAPKLKAWLATALDLIQEFADREPSEALPEDLVHRAEEVTSHKRLEPSKSKAMIAEADAIKSASAWLMAIAQGLHIHLTRSDTSSLRKVCHGFQERWRRHCAREGILSHDDCLGLAHELLRENPDLCRKIGETYRQILVDEFQDTDPLQYEILFLLGRDWEAPEEESPRLREGLFCIVGDPKQSIYRFRGADMTAFELAVGRMEQAGGARLDLSVNFRSTGEILEVVNETMEGLIEPSEGIQPDYVPLAAPPTPREAQGVTAEFVHLVFEPGKSEKRREEARMLAAKVREIAEDRRKDPAAELPWRDIVLLFRASTEADLYALELREAGIPVLQEGSRKFYTRHEIERFLAFLRALVRPHDEAALVAWLRSPMVAAKDSELLAFVEGGGSWEDFYSEAEPETLPQILSVARHDLERLRTEIRNLPASESLAHLFHDGLISPIEAAGYGGQQAWANLERLIQVVGDWSEDRSLDLEEALDRLERDSLGEKTMEESPLADPGLNAVRLLTAHSSKGLQFPVVVLPDLARGTNQQRVAKDFLLVRDRAGSRLLVDREPFQSPLLPLHLLQEARHEKAERLRLLYVAMTRAEDRLLLSYCDKQKGVSFANQPWAHAFARYGFDPRKTLDDGSLMGRHIIHRRGESPPRKRRKAPKGIAPGLLSLRVEEWGRSAENALALLRPQPQGPSHHEPGEDQGLPDATGQGASGDQERAAELGTLLHAYLACMQQDEVDLKTDRLQALEPSDEDLRNAAAEILRTWVQGELADRFAQARILGRELPLLYRDPREGRWQGSMDLVIEERGEILVVDYKSDRVTREQVPERALLYENQLRLYAEALQSAWRLDELPHRELWFLRTDTSWRFD